MAERFPALTGRAMLALLRRAPLSYRVVRQRGSHRSLRSERGFPPITFAFHDGATVPPAAVRKILVQDVGLDESTALSLL